MRQFEAYCPVNGWDCPYYHAGGKCAIENPVEECEDYMSFFYEDYLAGENPYTNEPRTVFE